jgi:hypothetical protein
MDWVTNSQTFLNQLKISLMKLARQHQSQIPNLADLHGKESKFHIVTLLFFKFQRLKTTEQDNISHKVWTSQLQMHPMHGQKESAKFDVFFRNAPEAKHFQFTTDCFGLTSCLTPANC